MHGVRRRRGSAKNGLDKDVHQGGHSHDMMDEAYHFIRPPLHDMYELHTQIQMYRLCASSSSNDLIVKASRGHRLGPDSRALRDAGHREQYRLKAP